MSIIYLSNRAGEIRKLFQAVEEDQIEEVAACLDKGEICVDDLDPLEASKRTALQFAASLGHYRIVELLLNRGAQIDFNKTNYWTALHMAAGEGHLNVVQLLVNRGAKMDDDRAPRTPLELAAWKGHLKVVEFLFNQTKERSRSDGWTLLHTAASGGHRNIVEFLLDRGLLIDQQASNGITALHLAVENAFEKENTALPVVALLLERGAAQDLEAPLIGTAFDLVLKASEELFPERNQLIDLFRKTVQQRIHAAFEYEKKFKEKAIKCSRLPQEMINLVVDYAVHPQPEKIKDP